MKKISYRRIHERGALFRALLPLHPKMGVDPTPRHPSKSRSFSTHYSKMIDKIHLNLKYVRYKMYTQN